MGAEIKKLYVDTINLRNAIMMDSNVDILLYLAKYNPNVTREDVMGKFGKGSDKGLELLKQFHLVKEENSQLYLTSEGIFQVEGLLTMAV